MYVRIRPFFRLICESTRARYSILHPWENSKPYWPERGKGQHITSHNNLNRCYVHLGGHTTINHVHVCLRRLLASISPGDHDDQVSGVVAVPGGGPPGAASEAPRARVDAADGAGGPHPCAPPGGQEEAGHRQAPAPGKAVLLLS